MKTLSVFKDNNYDDGISEFIIKSLFCDKLEIVNIRNDLERSHYITIGSILSFANDHSIVWGSGFISQNSSSKGKPDIRCVRGPMTRTKFLEQGIPCPEKYGDPAVLMRDIYTPKSEIRYKYGVIPHYVDVDHPAIKDFISRDDALYINIRSAETPFKLIDEIAQCEVIYSSSLHGLIMAVTYGKPCVWMKLSDKIIGGRFKFDDFFASVGIKVDYLDLSESKVFEDDDDKIIHVDMHGIDKLIRNLYETSPFSTLQTYWINLDRCIDRAKHMRQELERIGLKATRISAVDGSKLENWKEYTTPWTHSNDHYHVGTIACSLSHIKCYKQFLKTDKDYCLIFEDDVTLCDDFNVEIDHDVDITLLHKVIKGTNFGHGAYAYAVSRKAASTLIDYYVPITHPADHWGTIRRNTNLTIGSMDMIMVTHSYKYGSVRNTVKRSVKDVRSECKRLITCCPKSGDGYTVDTFKANKYSAAHERHSDNCIVSWGMTANSQTSAWGPGSQMYKFKKIVHQVRSPLTNIPTIMKEPKKSWDYIRQFVPEILENDDMIVKAAKCWYYWNLMAEKKSEHTFQVERLAEEEQKMDVKPFPEDGGITVKELKEQLPEELYTNIILLAKKYGYGNLDIKE